MAHGGSRARRLISPLLIAAAALLIGLAGTLFYVERNLFDSDRFADHAADALAKPDVRDAVADRLTQQIVRAEPDLTGAAPLIESASGAIIGTEAFRRLFASAVADLHRTVFARDRDTVALKVTDVGLLVVDGLEAAAPKVAAKIPSDVQARLLAISDGRDGLLLGVARIGDEIAWIWIAALVLGALALVGAFVTSTDRRRTIPDVALALTAVGVLGIAGYEIGRIAFGGLGGGENADALRDVWASFFGGYRTWAIGLAGAGLIIAAAGFELIRPLDARAALMSGWERVGRTPESPVWRGARALAMLALGIAIVVLPDAAVRAVTLLAGGLLLYAGAAELLRLIAPAPRASAPGREEREDQGGRRLAVAGTATIAVAVVVAITVAIAGGVSDTDASGEIDACNGSPELCDRTVDEVAFAGTHNSFSAADRPNWFFAQQEKGLPAQLDAGIRTLLIDTHYGVRTDRGVYTVLEEGSTSREKIEEPLGKQFVDTALRLRDRINPGSVSEEEKRLFFCHAFCELGAQPTIEGLKQIRDFLVRNPNEVVLLSVESDVSLEANADAFEKSGLLDLVWKGPFTEGRFPTLREMIERNQRAAVLMWQRGPLGEAGFGDYPWMHRQFGVLQETPYEDLTTVASLKSPDSCAPNEGRDTNPMFLLNNWVETSPYFKPSNARKVNAYDTLLERARMCEEIRDEKVNIIAVDFFEQGDVTGVVRTLNGLPPEGG
ncbi:hypothetical protein HJD18_10720 [Thermoleophilia bacterium SCSIO 60948]|nr:hypothetical protein HJD18_10720 [Thermoleophilia bacterium SCSIO 60948]